MKEKLNKDGIPTRTPTEAEKIIGGIYVGLVRQAVEAREALDAINWDNTRPEFDLATGRLLGVYRKASDNRFSTQLFTEVVDLSLREKRRKEEHGKT